MPAPVVAERHALADLLLAVGPDAPTLCEGWTTADLAVHLVVRERRPDAALGLVVPALAGHLTATYRAVRDRVPWPDLVATFRRGPPLLLRPVDAVMNTAELFVHHEDVRRAPPGARPRELSPELDDALWRAAGSTARLLRRRLPVGLELRSPGRPVAVRAGTQRVTVAGPPGEVLLFLFGRQSVAEVEISGDAAAVARLRQADLGV